MIVYEYWQPQYAMIGDTMREFRAPLLIQMPELHTHQSKLQREYDAIGLLSSLIIVSMMYVVNSTSVVD